MKIKEFEQKIGMRVEGLNEERFIEILKNPEFKKLFDDKKEFLDLLEEILNRNQDESFKKEVNILKYTLQLLQDEEIIDGLFKRYREEKITREKLLEAMKNYRDSSDPIFVVSVFICSIIALKDVDLRPELENLKKNIEMFKPIFESLGRIESSYQIRADLIDLLYTVRTKVFVEYGESIDVSWVDEETNKLDEFGFELLNNRELPEINIKPEQLGFIDITKLKKE